MDRPLTILGLETSCDETAAAVVRGRPGAPGEILSSVVWSQIRDHSPYGGVVPEIAARAHLVTLDEVIARALAESGCRLGDLDAIAATAGPGLIGGVMVGLMAGKGLSVASGKPLLAVNHLAGHALSARLVEQCDFPYLLLLVSGGHCQLLRVNGPTSYRLLGTTIDDAVGEAFDKVAILLGLGFPGGPAIERAAKTGNPRRFAFPRPLLDRPSCHFSFSGLKTAVRYQADAMDTLSDDDVADLAASFQAAVVDILKDRTARALRDSGAAGERLVVAGGVAANRAIREALADLASEAGARLIVPPPTLCTDNGAMIAWAGLERFASGESDPLDTPARARWPLVAE
ncbi:MAG: tRNA (adenosine(37)-N6)-threonylcarbamoyltransferase complex transferase subunit TsaD [Alphaproteobacteria bacterium]|nr:tRNA (adenosine(37)-N6)-threonylcarbamoyltransferase complex transferase subunit TsaD [Alphaproteobacteria bacterium]